MRLEIYKLVLIGCYWISTIYALSQDTDEDDCIQAVHSWEYFKIRYLHPIPEKFNYNIMCSRPNLNKLSEKCCIYLKYSSQSVSIFQSSVCNSYLEAIAWTSVLNTSFHYDTWKLNDSLMVITFQKGYLMMNKVVSFNVTAVKDIWYLVKGKTLYLAFKDQLANRKTNTTIERIRMVNNTVLGLCSNKTKIRNVLEGWTSDLIVKKLEWWQHSNSSNNRENSTVSWDTSNDTVVVTDVAVIESYKKDENNERNHTVSYIKEKYDQSEIVSIVLLILILFECCCNVLVLVIILKSRCF